MTQQTPATTFVDHEKERPLVRWRQRSARLARHQNTSAWNNRRDRNVAEYAPHIHNASLQVVRKASVEPIKYLMKHFEFKANQETLAGVQRVAEDISRLEEASATCSAARPKLSP